MTAARRVLFWAGVSLVCLVTWLLIVWVLTILAGTAP